MRPGSHTKLGIDIANLWLEMRQTSQAEMTPFQQYAFNS